MKIKQIVLILLVSCSLSVAADNLIISDLKDTTLTDVSVPQGIVFINGKSYLYKPDKKQSMYRSTDLKSLPINQLEIGERYYFDTRYEETKTARGYEEKPLAVVFITKEKLPE